LHFYSPMMRRTLLTLALAGPAVAATWPAPAAAGGVFSVEGSYVSEDYGIEDEAAVQALTLRYIGGGKLQFRVDVPVLRVELPDGAFHTPVGPRPRGPGSGTDGGGPSVGNGNGSGNGSGPSQRVLQGGNGPSSGQPYDDVANGLGDVRLGLGRRIAGGGVGLYRTDAVFEVKLPTADEEAGLGTGEWDARLGIGAEYRFWSVTAFGGAGWSRLGDPDWVELQDPLDIFAGAESEPLAGERLILSGWIEGRQEILDGTGATATLALSLRSARGLGWRGSVAADVVGDYRRVSVMFGISFGVSSAGPGIRGVDR
jgi:hypothetical protein